MAKQPKSSRPKHRRKPRRPAQPGQMPGHFTMDPEAEPTRLRVWLYGPDHLVEREVAGVEELDALRSEPGTLWVDVQGLGDEAVLRGLGERFGLHALALEDIVHTHQRAKVDTYDGVNLVVMPMPLVQDTFESEQLSLVLGDGFLLTFQERAGDWFEPVRQRLRGAAGRMRQRGPDYLAYALIDTVIDAYFPLLQGVGDHLEALEDEVIDAPTRATVGRLHAVRRELVTMRRAVWPLREALAGLTREELSHVTDDTRVFLRDAFDHALRVIDMVESYRETSSSLMDVYLSSVSNRTNEVMQVLTVIATTFIPLTFVAGLYGMNFDPDVSPWNMPEVKWAYGYPFALGIMAAMAIGLLAFFRRKGWLGGGR